MKFLMHATYSGTLNVHAPIERRIYYNLFLLLQLVHSEALELLYIIKYMHLYIYDCATGTSVNASVTEYRATLLNNLLDNLN